MRLNNSNIKVKSRLNGAAFNLTLIDDMCLVKAYMMQTDEYADEVRIDGNEAQQIGIRGVPFFIIDRNYAVSGAQPTSVFLQSLEEAWNRWEKENSVASLSNIEDDICTINGNC